MPLLVRKIDRKQRWLEPNLSSDVMHELKTTDSMLSVWELTEDRSNLERVVAAMAATRQLLDKFDYVLLEDTALLERGFKFVRNTGATPDDEANKLWHLDVVNLKPATLASLAYLMHKKGQKERINTLRIRELLLEGIEAGRIGVVNAKLQTALTTP